MKNLDKATLTKVGLTAAGLLLTGLGSLLNNKVKDAEFDEKVAKAVAEQLQNQAK